MSGDEPDAVARALVWHAEDLRFHRPDVVLAFIDPATVRLDRYGGPVGAREAVEALARVHPYLARRPRPQSADAGAARDGGHPADAAVSQGLTVALRVAAGGRAPKGPA